MTEDKNKLRPDQWSDNYDIKSGFRCQMPTEYESERQGPFRLFRQDCSHHVNSTFEVRDGTGNLLERFKDFKSAKNDINERYAEVLKDQQDESTD